MAWPPWPRRRRRPCCPGALSLGRLSDGKLFTLPRDTYVKILKGDAKTIEQQVFYVLDREGTTRYVVSPREVIPIGQVAELSRPPTTYQEYSPRPRPREDTFKTSRELSLYLYQLSTQFLDHAGSSPGDPILGADLLYQHLFDFDFPLRLGGQISYGVGGNEQFTIRRWALGPLASVPLSYLNDWEVLLQVGATFSFLFDARGGFHYHNLSFRSQALNIGVRVYSPSPFLWGTHFSREFITPRTGGSLGAGNLGQATREERLGLLVGFTW